MDKEKSGPPRVQQADDLEDEAGQVIANAPDPDEDDLDDLDDLLDEFSSAKSGPQHGRRPSSDQGRSNLPADLQADPALDGDDEFSKELQAGMADLLGEIENSPEMQQQFEKLVKDFEGARGSARTDTGAAPSEGPSSKIKRAKPAEDTFQETIKKTMERMQQSGEQASAAAAEGDPDDILAQLLNELQKEGGEGAGNEEDFSKLLAGMMEELTNKDIIYEPMKELHEKFPAWMENNDATVPSEDLIRYKEQQLLVGEIVRKFEDEDYSDSKAADREFIVERIQKMQAAGSPPADLVGPMNPQEALVDFASGCPQQ
ncbi:MAG: hypothetical protein M1819_006015 [Sarea resinae]|nr:MAG: hypothetical protein M1819_006015 [Sarea resinae]